LATIEISRHSLPAGATVQIRYHAPSEISDQKLHNCDIDFASLGSLTVTADDVEGRPIRQLNGRGIEVTLKLDDSLLKDKESSRKLCFGVLTEGKPWECEEADFDSQVNTLKQRFNHLTSFAALLGTSSSCLDWMWILSVSLFTGLPTVAFVATFVALKTAVGKRFLLGHRGGTINSAMKRIHQLDPPL